MQLQNWLHKNLTNISMFSLGAFIATLSMYFIIPSQTVAYVDLSLLVQDASGYLSEKNKISEQDFLNLEAKIKAVIKSVPKNIVLVEKNKVINNDQIQDYTQELRGKLRNALQ